METFLTILHFLLCFFLIGTILLQQGKGANIGATFGGASQTLFGSRGPASFLSKLTAGVAALFIITSIWLAQIAKDNASPGSVLDNVPLPEATETVKPAAPEATDMPVPAEPDGKKNK